MEDVESYVGEGEESHPENIEKGKMKFEGCEAGEGGDNYTQQHADILLNTVVRSEKEAFESYCAYAHIIGFSVRKDHISYWPNSRNVKTRDFVCGKAGFKKELKNTETVKYRRSDTRSGCAAMIRYAVDAEGNWTVKRLIECHNHSLASPADKHLLRSSRKISDVNADVLRSLTQSGVRIVDAFNYLAKEVGGVENLECTKRDAFNFIQKDKRNRIENGDANALLKLFTERKTEDSMFEWDFEIDERGRLTSFFWSDGTSKLDYDCFGDVVIFDTSYRLNKYNLCCAPFVGVNHNWQNVLFGVGFLSDETVASFTWLFKTFIRIMGDNHPITIYTDQDQAMARAIEEVLPNTRHRLCQWHIYKKLPTKVHCGVVNKMVTDLFYKCMSKCESEEEFDNTWEVMIEMGHLHDNVWLDEMYNIRHRWSTAYNKDVFGMQISSTQRSESTNNICHGVSKPTSSITDCFLGLENVMRSWRRNEKDEDFKRSQSVIKPVSRSSPILRQAAAFYSKKLYSMFEEEFILGSCGLQLHASATNESEFYIMNLDDHLTDKHWVVHFDKLTMDIQCSCRKFEMMGLLCAHSLRVLNFMHIKTIPDKYLLLRWSATAKRDVYNSCGYKHIQRTDIFSGTTGDLLFQTHMQKFAYAISTKAKGNIEAEQCMKEAMMKLALDIDKIVCGRDLQAKSQPKKKKKPIMNNSNVGDPGKMRPKGISNSRLKGYWETRKRARGKQIEASNSQEPESFPCDPNISSIPDSMIQNFFPLPSRESFTDMLMDSLPEFSSYFSP